MKTPVIILILTALLLVSACSTVGSRIRRSQESFNSWPADVQSKVRQGQIAVGFTAAQVRVALGEPVRVVTRATEGRQSEVWVFDVRKTRFSIGIGVGTGGGSTSFGGAVGGITGGGYGDSTRVTLEDGRVTAIEQRTS